MSNIHLPRWAAAVLLGLITAGATPAAGAQNLVTEDLRIPMDAAGPAGLEAVLVRPDDGGRHPLVIVSHGSPRLAEDRPGLRARAMIPELTAFARRGFVAVSVLRRGYGTSPGGWAETYGSCEDPDYAEAGRAGAADLKAAAAVLTRRPDVDRSKVLAVGVSAGGFATVALTADPPPGLVAAVSFAGGRGSSGPDQVCRPDALVRAFGAFGARSRVPMLWVYAQNDHFFGPALAARLVDAFTRAGGQVTYVQAAAFGTDGHSLFSPAGQSVWAPIVDRFLAAQSLSGTAVATPLLDPPHQIGVRAHRDFATFLSAPSHKAFAVSRSGAYGWRTARDTPEEAGAAAIRQCEAAGGEPCRLYAVDDGYAP